MVDHEKIKSKYGDTYKKIVNILLQHDPAGVFHEEHENTDEYNPKKRGQSPAEGQVDLIEFVGRPTN